MQCDARQNLKAAEAMLQALFDAIAGQLRAVFGSKAGDGGLNVSKHGLQLTAHSEVDFFLSLSYQSRFGDPVFALRLSYDEFEVVDEHNQVLQPRPLEDFRYSAFLAKAAELRHFRLDMFHLSLDSAADCSSLSATLDKRKLDFHVLEHKVVGRELFKARFYHAKSFAHLLFKQHLLLLDAQTFRSQLNADLAANNHLLPGPAHGGENEEIFDSMVRSRWSRDGTPAQRVSLPVRESTAEPSEQFRMLHDPNALHGESQLLSLPNQAALLAEQAEDPPEDEVMESQVFEVLYKR